MVKSATVKKSQPSRKGPKAWRKNVDITDVEQHIDDAVKDAMAGGSAQTKPDAELFVVDNKGDIIVKKKMNNVKLPLRIDQILGERSKVHALGVRSLVPQLKKTELSRHTRDAVKKQLSKKDMNAVKKIFTETRVGDIWAASSVVQEVVPDNFKVNAKKPETMNERPMIADSTPAVVISHPGTSYNPSADDHAAAIQLAYQEEIDRIAELERLDKMAAHKKVLLAIQSQPGDASMAVDLPSEDEDEEHTGSFEPIVKSVPKRKTKQDRKKAQVARDEVNAKLTVKELRSLDLQLNDLKKIAKQTEAELAAQELKAQERLETVENARKTKSARLSKHRYVALPMTIKLSDEQSDSLRTLKPEANLFKERFNSMQKRNLIETRIPASYVLHLFHISLTLQDSSSLSTQGLRETHVQEIRMSLANIKVLSLLCRSVIVLHLCKEVDNLFAERLAKVVP